MTNNDKENKSKKVLTRRNFLKSSAAAGMGMALASPIIQSRTETSPEKINPSADTLQIALIGAGAQGRVLIESCLRLPDIQIKAVLMPLVVTCQKI